MVRTDLCYTFGRTASVIVVVVVRTDIDILNHWPNSRSRIIPIPYDIVAYICVYCIHLYFSDLGSNLINFLSEAHGVGIRSRKEFRCKFYIVVYYATVCNSYVYIYLFKMDKFISEVVTTASPFFSNNIRLKNSCKTDIPTFPAPVLFRLVIFQHTRIRI